MINSEEAEKKGMQFIKKICIKCKRLKKYLVGSLRCERSICGDCWEWQEKDEHPKNMIDEKDL